MEATTFIRLFYEVLLRVRILREHEKASTADEDKLTERELLALEIIKMYAPLKESQLGRVLGLQTSSLAELIRGLVEAGYVTKGTSETDKRQRPLELTNSGSELLSSMKRGSARRYLYLVQGLPKIPDADKIVKLLKIINDNITLQIAERCFGRHLEPADEEDDFDLERALGLPQGTRLPTKRS